VLISDIAQAEVFAEGEYFRQHCFSTNQRRRLMGEEAAGVPGIDLDYVNVSNV
jgi:hypothetical protein